jgi:hypothetical protein
MSRINKEWEKYYPNTPSSTNQLSSGPSTSPSEEKSQPSTAPCYTDLPCIRCDSWNSEKGECTINRIKAQFFYSGGRHYTPPTEGDTYE